MSFVRTNGGGQHPKEPPAESNKRPADKSGKKSPPSTKGDAKGKGKPRP